MIRVSPAFQISLGLAALTASTLLAADMIGLIPDRSEAVLDARKKTCQSLAAQFSLAAERNDLAAIERTMRVLVRQNGDILSMALRRADAPVTVAAGDHERLWKDAPGDASTSTHARVPVFRGETRWGTAEVRFAPIRPSGFLAAPIVKLVAFVTLTGFIMYLLVVSKVIRGLDGALAAPVQVKSAMNAMTEGVVIMDASERIVLANAAFADLVGESASALAGRRIGEFNWSTPNSDERPSRLPWRRAMSTGQAATGVRLALSTDALGARTFTVSGVEILDRNGATRGALATFNAS